LPTRPPNALPAPTASPYSSIFIELVGSDGKTTVIARPGDGAAVPNVSVAQIRSHATPTSATRPFDARSAGGSATFRAVAIRSSSDSVTLIALPTKDIDATFGRVRLGVILVTGALIAALTLAAWWVERLGIRPIKRVTDAASAIAGGDLEHRVEPAPAATEAGELARAFNIMVDARQSSEEQLRQFVADASHELRTPLSTITGVLELYNSGMLSEGPQLSEALRRAAKEADRMSGLISDLLLLTRLDQGRPLVLKPVDLGSIVADAAFDAALVGSQRTVTTDVAPNALVVGDEGRIRQVVTNLVSNAVTYTSANGHIGLRVCVETDSCVLEVADDGPGLSADEAARIFDRFYRTDVARSRSNGGVGLGLSIVASIVAAHHGDVAVESALGQGTTFRVRLPRRAPSLA
jgi:two-component system OmpR family sensor kinase